MKKFIDLTGQQFGKLTVKEFLETKNKHRWFLCICECGGQTITTSNNLRRGHTISCGCVNKKLFREASFTHRLSKHPLYHVWTGMRSRCYYITNNRYYRYGGRGITVCDEWTADFKVFYDWAIASGWAKGLQIDRIDNNGNYEPSNCRFLTPKEQSRNRSSNFWITINGVSRIASEWSLISGIAPQVITGRIRKGVKPEDAVFVQTLSKH